MNFSRTINIADGESAMTQFLCTHVPFTLQPRSLINRGKLHPVFWVGNVCHAGRIHTGGISFCAKSQHSEKLGALQKAISQKSYCFK